MASALVAAAFVAIFSHRTGAGSQLPRTWSLVPFAIDYVVGMLVAGRTLGMYLLGLQVVRVDASRAVSPAQAVVRTALLMVLVPALISDRDGRGLHDRLAGTVVIRA